MASNGSHKTFDPRLHEADEISDQSGSEIRPPADMTSEKEGPPTPSDPASKEAPKLPSSKAEPKPFPLSSPRRLHDMLPEQEPRSFAVPERDLRRRTRRDFLILGLGTLAAAAAAGLLLPSDTLRGAAVDAEDQGRWESVRERLAANDRRDRRRENSVRVGA